MVVTAFLEIPGVPRKGVLVPRSALIRYGGKVWVYLQNGEEEFIRRMVEVDHPEPGADGRMLCYLREL